MTIEVANESGMAVDEAALVSLAEHVLAKMGVNRLAELSVMLVDIDAMTGLHEKWMDEPGPTDVLAFAQDDLSELSIGPGSEPPVGPALLGDVVICPQVAERQAAERGHSTADEIHVLCCHGVLHLLGFDHATEAQEAEMFTLQGRLLAGWQRSLAAGRGSGARRA